MLPVPLSADDLSEYKRDQATSRREYDDAFSITLEHTTFAEWNALFKGFDQTPRLQQKARSVYRHMILENVHHEEVHHEDSPTSQEAHRQNW